ncbi:hypothetical protein FF38_05593 [Lucilia cuprina]|uniref:Uncharacterized protein n=1 Tax=Lucilia cuprina TaxID=7375 RepID=A0A0L0BV30_LUCCU|nr:hypothetical protein FF38_05593 [Lucilia cuprina]
MTLSENEMERKTILISILLVVGENPHKNKKHNNKIVVNTGSQRFFNDVTTCCIRYQCEVVVAAESKKTETQLSNKSHCTVRASLKQRLQQRQRNKNLLNLINK